MKVITFKAKEDLIEMLDMYAVNHGLNRSEAIREAIERLLMIEAGKKAGHSLKIEKGKRVW